MNFYDRLVALAPLTQEEFLTKEGEVSSKTWREFYFLHTEEGEWGIGCHYVREETRDRGEVNTSVVFTEPLIAEGGTLEAALRAAEEWVATYF